MKVFYHSADPDGWCSAAIIHQAYPKAEFYGINYGEEFPWDCINQEDSVWMADYTLKPFEDMLRLRKMCHTFIWIDHHISAIKEYEKSPTNIAGIQKVGRGACELVWEFIHPDKPIPLAVKLIASYDVWDYSDPRTVPFVYGIRSDTNPYPFNPLLWNTLLLYDEKKIMRKINAIIDRGNVVLDFLQTENYAYVNAYSFETEINGYRVIACNRGIAGSKLFDSIWDAEKYDIMCTFCRLPSKKWTISLYSYKPDVDVSKIAVEFGGGGHKGAAGFQCDDLPFYY